MLVEFKLMKERLLTVSFVARCEDAGSSAWDICPEGCHVWPQTKNPAEHAADKCPSCNADRYKIVEYADGRKRYTPKEVCSSVD